MDHLNKYRDKMQLVQPPLYLKNRVQKEMSSIAHRETASSRVCATENPQEKKARRPSRGSVVLSAAAVVLVAIMAIPFIGSLAENVLPVNNNAAQAENSFMLSAYAATPEVEYPQIDGLLTFGNAYGGSGASEAGEYGNWMFSVKGEGIVQVDFEISSGQIYSFASQNYSDLKTIPLFASNDPKSEAVRDALREKLGGDFVPGPSGHSTSTEDGDNLIFGHISGCRLLGSNATVTTPLGGGGIDLTQVSFGFYVDADELIDNPAYEEDTNHSSTAFMAALDGQTLTVQVHFADGSSSSESYTLRAKKMKVAQPAVLTIDEVGRGVFITYLPVEAAEGEDFIYVLFGEPATEIDSPVIPSDTAEASLRTEEFLVTSCNTYQEWYELDLDDLQHEALSKEIGYTHTAGFSADAGVVVTDSDGEAVNLDSVDLQNKRVRITFYDVFSSASPFPHKGPELLRGVTKIEILEDYRETGE